MLSNATSIPNPARQFDCVVPGLSTLLYDKQVAISVVLNRFSKLVKSAKVKSTIHKSCDGFCCFFVWLGSFARSELEFLNIS